MRRWTLLTCAALAMSGGALVWILLPDAPPDLDAVPPGALLRLGTLRGTVSWGGGLVTLSPDGRTVAVSGHGSTVFVLDVASGERLAKIALGKTDDYGTSDEQDPLTVRFSRDGRRISVAGYAAPRNFEVDGGRELTEPQPDLDALARGRREFRIPQIGMRWMPKTFEVHVIDAFTRQDVRVLAADGDPFPHVDLSPDGRVLAVADPQGLSLFEVDTGEQLLRREMTWAPSSLLFSPDGLAIACTTADEPKKGATRFLSARTGEDLREPIPPTGGDWAWNIAFAPDGQALAQNVDFGGPVRLLDVVTGAVRWTLPDAGWCSAAFSEDGRMFVTCETGGHVRFWDVATGEERLARGGHRALVRSVACSPVAEVVATAGDDHAVRLWNLTTGSEIRTLRLPPRSSLADEAREIPDDGDVRDVAWSPRGDRLAVAGSAVRVLDPATRDEARALESPEGPGAWSVAFSADGKLVAAARRSPGGVEPQDHGSVRVWDLATGALRFDVPAEDPYSVEFLPDGSALVTFELDRHVLQVRDPATGAVVRTIGDPGEWHDSAALSPDGRAVAFTRSNSVTVVEAATGAFRWSGPGDEGPLAWSPDGSTLACGDEYLKNAEHGISLLDAATGARRHAFDKTEARVTCLAFSADGRRLVSGHTDGTAIVWDVAAALAEPR